MVCSKTRNEEQGFFHQPVWVTSPGPKLTGANPTPVPSHILNFFEICEILERVTYTLRAARICAYRAKFCDSAGL